MLLFSDVDYYSFGIFSYYVHLPVGDWIQEYGSYWYHLSLFSDVDYYSFGVFSYYVHLPVGAGIQIPRSYRYHLSLFQDADYHQDRTIVHILHLSLRPRYLFFLFPKRYHMSLCPFWHDDPQGLRYDTLHLSRISHYLFL